MAQSQTLQDWCKFEGKILNVKENHESTEFKSCNGAKSSHSLSVRAGEKVLIKKVSLDPKLFGYFIELRKTVAEVCTSSGATGIVPVDVLDRGYASAFCIQT